MSICIKFGWGSFRLIIINLNLLYTFAVRVWGVQATAFIFSAFTAKKTQ